MRYNQWRLEYRPGGWIRGRDETGRTVLFRVAFVGDGDMARPQVRIALMDSPEPISARSWRDAPFREVELHALVMRERLARPAETEAVESLIDYFDRTAADYDDFQGTIPTDEIVPEPGEPAAHFRLTREPGSPLTDEFLADVAAMYRWAIASDKAPAPVIAESAGVPVSRVHRWVAQARRRGYLPPGIKGRVG
ncbi:MAG TPA: hypothetical protein VNF47_23100 [Streptosporangiaceae bacterium]|nr:hypothetical protein [Streptosporangiaceae bacterium]